MNFIASFQVSAVPSAIHIILALAFGAASLLPAPPVNAADANRALLLTFCDAANIKGATCKRAKGYPNAGKRACDVALRAERYSGKFLASGSPLLVVFYDSGCEAHTTDNGGAIVFEETGGTYAFKSFEPGMQGSECVTLSKNEQHDLLVCLTGHMGQGILESRVAQMAFAQTSDKGIKLSLDVLLEAENSVGAYGTNTVTCEEPFKVFGVSKLSSGPRPNTVAVDATYADAAVIKTICGKRFFKPPEAIGELAPGEAYVPDGYEKSGRLVIDIATRKVAAQ